jgi:ATP/maltotriose-dependent transcriptional regulator MalT
MAELRRRQGRLNEAEELLEQAQDHPLSILGRAHLALDRGDLERAADLAERAVRNLPEEDRTGRAAWLEVVARVRAGLGDHAEAAAAADELRAIADAIGTHPLRASARFADGVVTAATGDHRTARRLLEDATDLFARCGAPFETARSRIELAEVLQAMGRTATAIEELQRALSTLRQLGAGHEAAHAASLLGQVGAPARGGVRSGALPPGLTTRQRDVLRLVAEGLSDKEIARRLALSEHTVHRHIANILTRFGVPSRAAAVAQAKEHALL